MSEVTNEDAIKGRKIHAVTHQETIVFAIRGPDQHGNYAVATLENPFMLIMSGTKEQAIKNAFDAYLFHLDKDKQQSSGDTEVSQSTTTSET